MAQQGGTPGTLHSGGSEGIQYEVMISYKWKDSKDLAEEVQEYLQKKNKRVYRDESENEGGQNIEKQWQQAIRTCRVFLPILSKHYPQGTPENEFFYNKDEVGKPIVPIVMRDFVMPTRYGLDDVLQLREEDYEGSKELFLKKILDAVEDKLKGGMPGTMTSGGSEGGMRGIVRSEGSEGPKFSETPTLDQLKGLKRASGEELNIIEYVASDWSNIAIVMNFDDHGRMQDTIQQDYTNVTLRCEAMFKAWLGGKGRGDKPTWSTLIQILRRCKLNMLAQDIEDSLS